jgi:GNAT superfamily N-acetyltransferase
MAWRMRTSDWKLGKGAKNKRAFKKLVVTGGTPGVIGYDGKRPVAWCAVAPREQYSALARSRVLKPVDDEPVWSISCLFVHKEYRRRGISADLLRAAVEFSGKRGAKLVEGYPIVPTMQRTPDAFVWTGLPSSFVRAGFREVLRRSKNRPIMRYVLK